MRRAKRCWWTAQSAAVLIAFLGAACAHVHENAGAPGSAPGRTCAGRSAAELTACVDPRLYGADLELIAQPRPPGSPHHRFVQNLCASRLARLGYDVEVQRYATGANVVGRRRSNAAAREEVIVSAHYDHIEGCPGADDDASGVAGALEVARVLAGAPLARDLVIACWDEEEEDGFPGSSAYVARARARGDAVAIAYVLEMIGFRNGAPHSQALPDGLHILFPAAAAQIQEGEARADFIAVVADDASSAWTRPLVGHAQAASLPIVTLTLPPNASSIPPLQIFSRSDHASFWRAGYAAVMVTDSAEFRNVNYHCGAGPDALRDVDLEFATRVVRAVTGAAFDALQAE